MRYLEDWQLNMLQDGLNEEAVVEEYASKHNVHDLMAVPASWLEPLLAEVRASRTPAVTPDPLWEAVQKVGKELDKQANKTPDKPLCPGCSSTDLDPAKFLYCHNCHDYYELP